MDPRVADLMDKHGISEEEASVMLALMDEPPPWEASSEAGGEFFAVRSTRHSAGWPPSDSTFYVVTYDLFGRESERQLITYDDEALDVKGGDHPERLTSERVAAMLVDPDSDLLGFLTSQPVEEASDEVRFNAHGAPDGYIETRRTVKVIAVLDEATGRVEHRWEPATF